MVLSVAGILLLLALICFILAAIGIGGGRINLVALGLAFLTAAQLFYGK